MSNIGQETLNYNSWNFILSLQSQQTRWSWSSTFICWCSWSVL